MKPKLKYQIPTSLYHIVRQIVPVMLLICFVIAIMVSSAQAMKQRDEYHEGECELVAKDYQREFGGSLMWLQPINANGAYALGTASAHLINKVYSKEFNKYKYIDYFYNQEFDDEETVISWWESNVDSDQKVELFDLSRGRPPFAIYWHY